jgi:hypothetical protein
MSKYRSQSTVQTTHIREITCVFADEIELMGTAQAETPDRNREDLMAQRTIQMTSSRRPSNDSPV